MGISITSNNIDLEDGGFIGSSTNKTVLFNGNVQPAGSDTYVGLENAPYTKIYGTNIYGNVNPDGNTSDMVVYGCRFENQIIYSNTSISAGSTYTLNTSKTFNDFQFITILGGTKYTRGVVTFPAALYFNWYDASHRLVISSDSEYLAVYFPNSTQICIEGKSSALKEIKVYGIW